MLSITGARAGLLEDAVAAEQRGDHSTAFRLFKPSAEGAIQRLKAWCVKRALDWLRCLPEAIFWEERYRVGRLSNHQEVSDLPVVSVWSGRRDLNPRPPVPQTGALTGLRHAPTGTARTIGCPHALN